MSARLQIADDTNFSGSDLFTFEVYPSEVIIPDGYPLSTSLPLDGMPYTQAPKDDRRALRFRFDDLRQHTHWAGADTIIKELRARLYRVTGSDYYLRVKPSYDSASAGTTGSVSGSDYEVSGAGWTVDQWIDYALVDGNNDAFRITDNDEDTLNWDTDEGTPANGNFTIVDRKANPLYPWNNGQGDGYIQVRILEARVGRQVPQSLQKVLYPFEVRMHAVFS